MFTLTLYLSFFLRLLFLSTAVDNPTEYFLLDCGSTSNTTSQDGRNWDGDDRSKFSPAHITAISNVSTASEQKSGIDGVPYMTARIIHSPFTYTFPVSAGPKFLRLYFYPVTYSGLNNSQSFFNVTSGGYTLLSNFSAFLTAQREPSLSLVKEFIVVVKDNQRLEVTFSPSPNSYAFVNGIEVVPIPDNFYIRGKDYRIKYVGQINDFYIDSSTALEKIYRLNVGGNEVGVTDDTGMYRSWVQDDDYIYGAGFGFTPHLDIPIQYTSKTPNYTAPKIVYTTSRTMGNNSLHYNLTWIFPVDSGFFYLLRLHFCEIQLEVTLPNQRVFTIFIYNQTAEEVADVITWSTGRGIPVFKDYVVWVPDDSQGSRSKQDLWLAMRPYLDSKPQYGDAILNGLEIFKLSSVRDGNLAGPNPEPVLVPDPTPTSTENGNSKRKGSSRLSVIIGGVVGGIAVFAILSFLVFRRRRRVKHLGTSVGKSSWSSISYTSL